MNCPVLGPKTSRPYLELHLCRSLKVCRERKSQLYYAFKLLLPWPVYWEC